MHELGPQAHEAQQLGHTVGPFAAVAHAVHQQRLADIVEQGHARVERAERVLEDHLDLGPQRQQLGGLQRREVDHLSGARAVEDFAAGRIDGAQDAARGGGLAAAAFANETQGFALVDGEVDAVDGAHVAYGPLQEALVDGEELLQAAHVEQRAGCRWGGRVAHAGSTASLYKKQLASWRSFTGCRLGTAVEQRSITSGQRG